MHATVPFESQALHSIPEHHCVDPSTEPRIVHEQPEHRAKSNIGYGLKVGCDYWPVIRNGEGKEEAGTIGVQ